MTLFSIARKNVAGNYRSYLIYFISMIFSVVIFYTFVSLQYNPDIIDSMQSPMMKQFVSDVFMQASIILILFVTVFIWYSNSFFTRQRKKEVGLYSLLGMRKKTIGSMLFYENLIMSMIAIVIGVMIGTLLSKGFAMILVKLLDSSVQVSISISLDAIMKTTIVFMIITMITSIHAYRLIYRFKLIELFNAEKEGEQAPRASIIVAGIAVILLAFSYWLVFQPIENTEDFLLILGLFFLTIIIGTFMLFHSATVYVLKLAQKRKSRYYRGMNMIGTSQLLYRIKGNARTFAMIALLSGITISVMSIGYSQYYNVEKDTDEEAPFSYTHMTRGEVFDRQVQRIVAEDSDHPMLAQLDIPIIMMNADVSKLAYAPTNHPADQLPTKLISSSTFAKISAILNRDEPVPLAVNEAAIIKPLYTDHKASGYVGREVTLLTQQGDVSLDVVEMLEERVMTWSFPDVYMVVHDDVFSHAALEVHPLIFKAYMVENQKSAKETSIRLEQLSAENETVQPSAGSEPEVLSAESEPEVLSGESGPLVLEGLEHLPMFTYYTEYREGLESAGLNIFLLGFLGLVFLAATGSMVYFKQLTDAHSDKARYDILRKIGVSRREIYKSVAQQTLFVFALPLTVGLVHSSMMLKAMSSINLIGGQLLVPVLSAMAGYVIIYLVYYVLCVNSFNRIVNGRS